MVSLSLIVLLSSGSMLSFKVLLLESILSLGKALIV